MIDLNDPRRLYIILAGAALIVGIYAWSGHLKTKIAQADGQVKLLRDEAKRLKADQIVLDRQLEAANYRYDVMAKESERLAKLAKLMKVPEPPPKAPETAEELTLIMRVALSPAALAVEDPNAQTLLSKNDAQKVFIYFEEAKRIPGFVAKVNAQGEAIVSLEATVKAAGDRFTIQGEALSLAGKQTENCIRQNAILTKEVSRVKTKGRLEKVLWGAAGLGVGFLASRR